MIQTDSPWTPERAPESSFSSAVADTSSPTVADTSSPAVADSELVDPMRQLETISSEFSTPKKARKGPYKSKRGQNKVQIAIMPEYEPISHPDRAEEHMVRLLPLSTKPLWLCIDDIPWLTRWLFDELRSGGVPVPKTDPLDELEGNCEAQHVHIRWDFGGAWEAIILACANRGRKFKCSVSESDARTWQAIGGDAR